MTLRSHLGWRKPKLLPHHDAAGACQHIIFRLVDAISSSVSSELQSAPPLTRVLKVEEILDRGEGSRLLADQRAASIVASVILHGDGVRYDLLSWCVMPTHVHVLLVKREGWRLHEVVQAWKSVSTRRINSELGRPGQLWAREYFDRGMRNERHRERAFAYIKANPVKAGLCREPSDWRWSSAGAYELIDRVPGALRTPGRRGRRPS